MSAEQKKATLICPNAVQTEQEWEWNTFPIKSPESEVFKLT